MDGRNNGKGGYEDIINQPHHVSSRHPQMSMKERATQFSPFAALTGYGDVIKETARFTDQMPELSEEEKEDLDYKLQMAGSFPGGNPEVRITCFVPDLKKEGGEWNAISGRVKRLDTYRKKVIMESGEELEIDRIICIEGI